MPDFDSGQIGKLIAAEFDFHLNRNQLQEIHRLFFDIARRDGKAPAGIVSDLKIHDAIIEKQAPGNRFTVLKQILLKDRFPLTGSVRKIKPAEVFLSKVPKPFAHASTVQSFYPKQIFIEESAQKYSLTARISRRFPEVEQVEMKSYAEYIKEHPFRLGEFKKPRLFLIKQNWDFIKPCPCTKHHLGCGYFVFNLGFGCPFDCSYCYLQHYANSPGIILPVNIEDFLKEADGFIQSLKNPVRLGSGEFCDSLALDAITGYAEELALFFRNKNVIFELKTKSAGIKGLLSVPGAENIVVSWSLNPQTYIDSEEHGAASLAERLDAARRVREKGYGIGFHFDPLIYGDGWEKLYFDTVRQLYRILSGPFAWISLGTLRSKPALKTIVEQRFPGSRIFYGELLIGKDRKLRYPYFLRRQIYRAMLQWIREFDLKTPVYLCMEEEAMWKELYEDIGKSIFKSL